MPDEKNDTVEIVLGDGSLKTANRTQANALIRRGQARLADSEDVITESIERKRERRYTAPGEKAKATAEGVARGVSAGLYDLFAEDLGADPLDVARRKAYNPGYSAGGELVGVIGGTLATGLGGFAGKAALATPVGALTKGSELLGRAVTKRLGGRTAARVAGLMTEGVVDGTIFEIGHAAGTAAIENRELTAEDVGGAVISGGLTGLLGGAAVGIGTSLASRGRRNLLKAGSAEAAELESHFDEMFGVASAIRRDADKLAEPPPVVGGRAVRAEPKVTDADFAPPAAAAPESNFVQPLRTPPKKMGGLPGEESQFTSAKFERQTEGMSWDEVKAQARGREAARRARRKADAPTETFADDIQEQFISEPVEDVSGLGATLRRNEIEYENMGRFRKQLEKELNGEMTGRNMVRKLTSFKSIDEAVPFLRRYGDYLEAARKVVPGQGDKLATEQITDVLGRVFQARYGAAGRKVFLEKMEAVAGAVEAVDLVGEAAGVDVVPLPDSVRPLLAFMAIDGVVRRTTKGRRGALASLIEGAGVRVGSEAGGMMTQGIAATPAGRLARAAARGAGAREGGILARKSTNALGLAIEKDLNVLVAREQRAQGRMSRAFNAFLNGQKKSTPARLAGQRLIASMFDEKPEPRKKESTDAAQFLKMHDDMQRLMKNPQTLLQKVDAAVGGLDLIQPDIAALARDGMLRTLDYLYRHMPKNPGSDATIFKDHWRPDPNEMSSWLRRAEAATDPAKGFELLAAGRLTPEAAETIRELHAAHLADFQQKLSEPENFEKASKLPTGQLVQLGLLLDMPTHSSLLMFNNLQANHQLVAEQAAQAAQPAPSPAAQMKAGVERATKAAEIEDR